ncbi:hypothetical protein BJ742DRAFT_774452 [Cladochytrium replicatum]|nr:hypothetical protein BJ742DRAFT_774452 [Cladochytrium replicatum]
MPAPNPPPDSPPIMGLSGTSSPSSARKRSIHELAESDLSIFQNPSDPPRKKSITSELADALSDLSMPASGSSTSSSPTSQSAALFGYHTEQNDASNQSGAFLTGAWGGLRFTDEPENGLVAVDAMNVEFVVAEPDAGFFGVDVSAHPIPPQLSTQNQFTAVSQSLPTPTSTPLVAQQTSSPSRHRRTQSDAIPRREPLAPVPPAFPPGYFASAAAQRRKSADSTSSNPSGSSDTVSFGEHDFDGPEGGASFSKNSSSTWNASTSATSADQSSASKKRTRATTEQLALLESTFAANQTPPGTVRRQLAIMCGMSERSVQVWFQNRRARTRLAQRKVQQTAAVQERVAAIVAAHAQLRTVKPETASSSSPSSQAADVTPASVSPSLSVTEDAATSSDFAVSFSGETLSIGTWLRTKTVDAQGVVLSNIRCGANITTRELIWQISDSGNLYRIVVPFDHITRIEIRPGTNPSEAQMIVDLSTLPYFLTSELLSPVAGSTTSVPGWVPCCDFSENAQASTILRHVIRGAQRYLEKELFMLMRADSWIQSTAVSSGLVLHTPGMTSDALRRNSCPDLLLLSGMNTHAAFPTSPLNMFPKSPLAAFPGGVTPESAQTPNPVADTHAAPIPFIDTVSLPVATIVQPQTVFLSPYATFPTPVAPARTAPETIWTPSGPTFPTTTLMIPQQQAQQPQYVSIAPAGGMYAHMVPVGMVAPQSEPRTVATTPVSTGPVFFTTTTPTTTVTTEGGSTVMGW